MTLRPAGRLLTVPFPPGPLAARFFAAVIRPPLLFFAILFIPFVAAVYLFTDINQLLLEVVLTTSRRPQGAILSLLLEPVLNVSEA